MSMYRRDLLRLSATTWSLAFISPSLLLAEPASEPLDILFLGGTGFIGPHMVRRALARGHHVTLFNRGNNPDEFPDLEQLVGDRDAQLGALEGRQWDAVIDTSGYVPRHVEDSAALMAAAGTPHYLFISTVAVYENFREPDMDESAPLATIPDPSVEEVTGETYGALKVLCEQAVVRHYPKAHTILRPTYIVGPDDHTDRFIYYIDRPLQGGRMPVPGPPEQVLSWIDVRDLAEFTIHSLERRIAGAYNMVNPPVSASFGDLMRESLAASGATVELAWVTPTLTAQQGLEWQFPMCPNPLENAGFGTLSQAAAVAMGFGNRPLAETVEATHDWWMSVPAERRQNKRDILPLAMQRRYLDTLDAAS